MVSTRELHDSVLLKIKTITITTPTVVAITELKPFGFGRCICKIDKLLYQTMRSTGLSPTNAIDTANRYSRCYFTGSAFIVSIEMICINKENKLFNHETWSRNACQIRSKYTLTVCCSFIHTCFAFEFYHICMYSSGMWRLHTNTLLDYIAFGYNAEKHAWDSYRLLESVSDSSHRNVHIILNQAL